MMIVIKMMLVMRMIEPAQVLSPLRAYQQQTNQNCHQIVELLVKLPVQLNGQNQGQVVSL